MIDEKDSKGKISVESQQRQMIDALRRLGVNVDKQLKVANLSSEFFKRRNSVATAKYQLQLGTAEMVSRVYEALDRVGISNISIQKVSHSQLEQLKQQVRVEAIRDAKRNAQTASRRRSASRSASVFTSMTPTTTCCRFSTTTRS